jgi:hypothetical protein
VVICHPVKYIAIMFYYLWILVVLICWIIMFSISLIHVLLMMWPIFSISTENHICEEGEVFRVAISDTLTNNIFSCVNWPVGFISTKWILSFYSLSFFCLQGYPLLKANIMPCTSVSLTSLHAPWNKPWGASQCCSPDSYKEISMYIMVSPILKVCIYKLGTKMW